MDLRNCLKVERIILTCAGIYPSRTENFRILRRLSAFFITTASIILFICVFTFVLKSKEFTDKVTEALLYSSCQFGYLIKLINCILRKHKIKSLENSMLNAKFIPNTTLQKSFWKEAMAEGRNFGVIFGSSAAAATAFYGLVPVIDQTGTKLTLPVWLPFDPFKYYWRLNVILTMGIGMSAVCNLLMDIMAWKFILVGSAQLDILGDRIVNSVKMSYDENDILQQLKECILHSNDIYSFVEDVENMFNIGIVVQLCCSVVVICTTGFQMIVVPLKSMQFILLASFFVCVNCQIGMYCFFGHRIMESSDKLTQACYETDWYECSVNVRKLLIIIMERAKRPILLKVGGLFPLTLQTLIAILRTSYSGFAVLRHIYKG